MTKAPMDLQDARAKAARLFPKLGPPQRCPLVELGRREVENQRIGFGAHIGAMTPPGFPIPALLYYGLTELLQLKDHGRFEKVAWTVLFSVDGSTFGFELQKFGLRFLLEPRNLDAPITKEVLGKARALMRIAETYLSGSVASQQVAAGNFTIENLFRKLDERYRVLRRQAKTAYEAPVPPPLVRDEGAGATYYEFYDHIPKVEGGAFATAAVDAYFSRVEHVGSVLSFVVSGFALYYAVAAGRKVDRDWREQRQLEKRADVAADALVAVYIMTRFLLNRALDTTPDRPGAMQLQEVDNHWNSAADVFDKLWLAGVNVEAHIPSAYKPLGELLDFAEKFRVRQSAFAKAHLGRKRYDDPGDHHAFGEVAKQQIEDLHGRAKAALLLHAQLKPPADVLKKV